MTCVIGNIMVVLSVFTYKPLQSVQNIFIVSLALADTFVAVFVMPFQISLVVYNKWIFGPYACHFFLALDILLCTASILHLCCIALDRYWAIKDSIRYAQQRTMKRVLVMILIAWLLSAVISLPVIIWNTVGKKSSFSNSANNQPEQNESIGCEIPDDQIYRLYSSIGTFFAPLFIMTWVYMRIFLETKRRLHERAKAASKLAQSIEKSALKEDSSIKVNEKKSFKNLIYSNSQNQTRLFCFKISDKNNHSSSNFNNNKKNNNATVKKKSLNIINEENSNFKDTNTKDLISTHTNNQSSKHILSADTFSIESSVNFNNKKNIDERTRLSILQKNNNDIELSSCSQSHSSERFVTTPKKEIVSQSNLENKPISCKVQFDEILIEEETRSLNINNKIDYIDDASLLDSDSKTLNKSLSKRISNQSIKKIINSTKPVSIQNSDKQTTNQHVQTTATIANVNPTAIWQQNANTGVTLKQRQKISLTRERRAARTLGKIS